MREPSLEHVAGDRVGFEQGVDARAGRFRDACQHPKTRSHIYHCQRAQGHDERLCHAACPSESAVTPRAGHCARLRQLVGQSAGIICLMWQGERQQGMLGVRQKPEHVRHGLVAQMPPFRVLVQDLLHGLRRTDVSELSEEWAELARDVIRWLVVVLV